MTHQVSIYLIGIIHFNVSGPEFEHWNLFYFCSWIANGQRWSQSNQCNVIPIGYSKPVFNATAIHFTRTTFISTIIQTTRQSSATLLLHLILICIQWSNHSNAGSLLANWIHSFWKKCMKCSACQQLLIWNTHNAVESHSFILFFFSLFFYLLHYYSSVLVERIKSFPILILA